MMRIVTFVAALLIASNSDAKTDAVYTGFFSNLAVAGYDVVAYFDQDKPVEGLAQYHLDYLDVEWRFSSQENLDRFTLEPETFAPHPRSEIEFWGSSFACGPQGEMLGQAGNAEQVLIVDLDLGRREELRRTWPFLRDRRVDLYGDLAKRHREYD